MDLEQLVLRIRVMADQADAAIDDVTSSLGKLDEANLYSEKVAKDASAGAAKAHHMQGQAAEASGAQAAAAYAAVAAASMQAFNIIVSAIKTGIDAHNAYEASITGLQSVASGRGIGGAELQTALDSVTDQFFDATAAAASFKNLLSRGYSLDQAKQAIDALKNSAAFGKQSHLSLAQAVLSATEGLKNENSILVDNAGVTKNVSKMWEDYAKTHGLAVANMSKSQKIQAEYAGIMEETKFQMGDLAKLTGTLAGAQAGAAMSGDLLARSYGDAMATAVGVATGAWGAFLESVRGVVTVLPEATAGLTATGLAATVLVGVVPAAAIAIKLFGTQMAAAAAGTTVLGVALGTAMPWLLGISAIIGLVTAAYTTYVNAQQAAAQAAADEAKAKQENLQRMQAENEQLTAMMGRYEALKEKKKLTYKETKEMATIEKTLESQYGITVTSLQSVAGAYEQVTGAIKDKIAANEAELQAQREVDAANAKTAAFAYQIFADAARKALANKAAAEESIAKIAEVYAKQKAALALDPSTDTSTFVQQMSDLAAQAGDFLGMTEEQLKAFAENEEKILATESGKLADWIKEELALAAGVLNADTGSENLGQMLAEKAWGDRAADGFSSSSEAQAFAQQLIDSFSDAVNNTDISEAKKTVDDFYSRVMAGGNLKADELASFEGAYQQLQQGAENVGAAFGLTANEVKAALLSMYPDLEAFKGGVAEWYALMQQFDPTDIVAQLKAGDISGLSKVTDEVKKQSDAYGRLTDEMSKSGQAVGALETIQKDWSAKTSEGYQAAQEYWKEYYGEYITSEEQIQQLLDEEIAKRDALIVQWQAQGMAYADTTGMLQTLRDAVAAALGEENEAVGILDEALLNVKRDYDDMARAAGKGFNGATQAVGDIQEATKAIGALQTKLASSSAMVQNIARWRQVAKAHKDGKDTAGKFAGVIRELGLASTASADDALKAIDGMEDGLANDTASMIADMKALREFLAGVANDSNIEGSIRINAANALSQISTLESALAAYLAKAAAAGVDTKPKGGGGGGKSPFQKDLATLDHEAALASDSLESLNAQLAALEALEAKYTNKKGKSTLKLDQQRELEERIHEMQEEIRQRELEADYDALDHKKALNQITLQEEIAELERIKAAHELTAEELEDIDERLYDAREALRQKEYLDALDALDHKRAMGELTVQQEIEALQAIVAAHELTKDELEDIQEQIYALQQQQQEEALNEQVDAVEKAYDKIVQALRNKLQQEKDAELAALDEKIAILQEQTDAENEEKRKQDYEEKLADKQKQLRLAKSSRERRELQEEIDKLIADEAQRQAQLARQAEIDALKDQKDTVQDKYDQLMDEENLRQEALRLVMSGNLQAMSDLIASYGPKWEDAGAQLADFLTTGITDQKTGIIGTLQDLLSGMSTTLKDQMDGILAGGGVNTGVTVNISDLAVREEADIQRVADVIYDRIVRAGG